MEENKKRFNIRFYWKDKEIKKAWLDRVLAFRISEDESQTRIFERIVELAEIQRSRAGDLFLFNQKDDTLTDGEIYKVIINKPINININIERPDRIVRIKGYPSHLSCFSRLTERMPSFSLYKGESNKVRYKIDSFHSKKVCPNKIYLRNLVIDGMLALADELALTKKYYTTEEVEKDISSIRIVLSAKMSLRQLLAIRFLNKEFCLGCLKPTIYKINYEH